MMTPSAGTIVTIAVGVGRRLNLDQETDDCGAQREKLAGEPQSDRLTALAIADALKDEPINRAALTWEATAPPERLRAMVKSWERLYDKGGSRLDA